MFKFISNFKKNNSDDSVITTNSSEVVESDSQKYIERIRILENKNLIFSKKIAELEKKYQDYETKYFSLLKASKEEINRVIDARKLLASDPNYRRDLQQLGLVSQKEHVKVLEKYTQLVEEYQSIKKDYEILSRKLNNILTENL
jgi:hypothetical protein